MEYYSQYKQDQFLDEQLFLKKEGGTFVDIGAHNGISFSNSYFFEKNRNWKGICIEPIPERFTELEKNRKCIKIQGCIYDTDTEVKFMRIEGYSEMLSGIIDDYNEDHLTRIENESKQYNCKKEVITVRAYNLQNLLLKYNLQKVDFCSIDTEGSELKILQVIDFSKIKFDVFVIENQYDKQVIRKFMKSKGFCFLINIGADDVFRHRSNISFFKRIYYDLKSIYYRSKRK